MKMPGKKLVLLGLILTVLLISAAPVFGAPQKARVFVQFAPGGKSNVQAAINAAGGEFHYTFDQLDSFVVSLPAQALEGLARNPNVVRIVEDSPRDLITSTPSLETLVPLADTTDLNGQIVPWGVDAVEARDVWDVDRDGSFDASAPTGDGIIVCIIDTGFYSAHEDFAGITLVGGTAQVDPPYTNDGFGHGTHVAGTIAAQNNQFGVVGVSPGVSFYIVKYFGDDGAAQLFASDLISGSNACVNNGAKIISMSLGGPTNNFMENWHFNSLYNSGVLLVAAAGNAGDTSFAYPASYNSVISVAAINEAKTVAGFSQQNNQVELAAPGVGVMSTLPFVDDTNLTVAGAKYPGNIIANAPRGSADGTLAYGGLCNATGSWSGQIVLCERGLISFFEKAMNVQNSGGVAAVIYNNQPGNFLGTLGDGNSTAIPVISLSQEDGQFLVANKLGLSATATSQIVKPASGYSAWNGTSMATPHVSAVAALLWSAKPTATNVEIRTAMTATAQDLGAAGRDNAYGYGLVRAKAALEYLGGITPPPPPPPPGDAPPEISITSPQDGNVLPMCTDSQFTAAASDAEDGDLSGSIVWTSSINNEFGTGSPVYATLSYGDHTITARVTDSSGQTASDSITVSLRNTAPTLIIWSPENPSTYAYGATIDFLATVMDPDQPDLGASTLWISDLIGQIGTGTSFSRTLPAGEHHVNVRVTDYCGVTSAATITVTVLPPPNTPPVVTITSPNDGAVFEAGTSIFFAGTVSDEDSGLSSNLAWKADGIPIGNGASFSAVLDEGTHTITASVTDGGGLPGEDTITVTVLPAVPALTVSVGTDMDVYGPRDKVVITAHVTDGINPVANANVSVTIVTNSGDQRVYTGITDGNGDYLINYKFNVRKDGYGEYSVYTLATLSGYLDGNGSDTFIVTQ